MILQLVFKFQKLKIRSVLNCKISIGIVAILNKSK